VVKPGEPALEEIAARFPEVIHSNGTLDRSRLAERIFNNDGERKVVNAIIHPRIQQRVLEQTAALREAGRAVILYDAPLLIENRLHEGMDGVILVAAPEAVQIERLMKRNDFTREQAAARLRSQLSLKEKLAAIKDKPHWVIDNAGDLASLQTRVAEVWREIAG
jgi:dephospho-CoA kinase